MALVHLSASDADRTMQLQCGDTVEVRLPETPATGYRWRWRLPEALRMVADEHVQWAPGIDVEGVRRLAFDVTVAGCHELRAELARPWEGEAREALTFVLHVG